MSDLNVQCQNRREQVIAERALLAFRELHRVMDAAPHGHGLEVLEHAVLEHGREQMRLTMQELADARMAAEKGGDMSCRAGAGEPRSSRSMRRAAS